MYYGKSKVYFDGSHYIAIPHTTRDIKKRPIKPEELITVVEEKQECSELEITSELSLYEQKINSIEVNIEDKNAKTDKKIRKITKKELFEELFLRFYNLSKQTRIKIIIEEMLQYFESEEDCKLFVEANFERKKRNLICRRVRMCRKANLANFNYFCTFTYDDKKHSEDSFKKGIKTYLRNMCYRKDWKYMGVWERAPVTERLHFHGLFNIPNNTMPGELNLVRDYDTISHKMQESYQNTYFNERFGRSDFKEINEYENKLGNAISYLMKYIEKTGEKIVYSKNLPQYFISDILENDIVCTIGQEDRKLLLFDDFKCLDDGEYIGNVCPKVIEQMKKSN